MLKRHPSVAMIRNSEMSGLPAAHLAVLLATLLSAGMMGKLTAAMELVKPTLMIPKDSYEEFLIRGPVTVSYVVNVINGTKIDAVFLDKANFIRFANKRDAEFVEEVWKQSLAPPASLSLLRELPTRRLPMRCQLAGQKSTTLARGHLLGGG